MGDKSNQNEFTNPLDGLEEGQAENMATDNSEFEGEDAQSTEIANMLLAMQEENTQLKERVLLGAADMENLRKRTQREVNDARSYAIADFARDMLGATDNLSRALAAFPDESRTEAGPNTLSLIEGIEMTEREMQRLMQKNGIKPMVAEGEKFNPHKHQAVFEVPDASIPPGIVVQVVQTGFEIGERVLRPAMVGVSKGGQKVAPEPKVTSIKIDPREDDANEFDDDTEHHIDREV